MCLLRDARGEWGPGKVVILLWKFSPPPRPPQFLTFGLAPGRSSPQVWPPETMALKGAERRRRTRDGFRLRIRRERGHLRRGRGGARPGTRNARRSTRLCCPPMAARGSASWGTLGASEESPRRSQTGYWLAGYVPRDVLFDRILLKPKLDHAPLLKTFPCLPLPAEIKILGSGLSPL